jgi:hypothetical protein
LQVANLTSFLEGTHHHFGGQGTVRDETKTKRRLHALKISCRTVGGVREPVMWFREHDEFAPYRGAWDNETAPLPIFRDINTLTSVLAGRTLMQTDHVRVDMGPVKAKVNAVVAQQTAVQALVQGREPITAPPFFTELFDTEDARWNGVPADVHTLKNNLPFDAVPLPTTRDALPVPALGSLVLEVSFGGIRGVLVIKHLNESIQK